MKFIFKTYRMIRNARSLARARGSAEGKQYTIAKAKISSGTAAVKVRVSPYTQKRGEKMMVKVLGSRRLECAQVRRLSSLSPRSSETRREMSPDTYRCRFRSGDQYTVRVWCPWGTHDVYSFIDGLRNAGNFFERGK